MADRLSFRDRVAAYFKAYPDTWISAYDLQRIGGAMAWRTRISDCRVDLKMDIRNRVIRDEHGIARSEYKFIPAPSAEPTSEPPHDLNRGFALR